MRREKKIRNLMILSVVILSVLIISLIGYLIAKSSLESNEEEFAKELTDYEDTESASTEIGKSINDTKQEFEVADIKENTVTNEESKTETTATKKEPEKTKKEEKNEKTEATKEEVKEKEEKPEFEAPLKGEIIREFANDSLVFSNTLQEWITHNGVDIKADKTSVVKSAAEGTVYAIKNDPRYGLTVIINHNGGYQTIYSNLLTAEFVVKGEKVEKGQSIGTVGNSASFEISDDYHLHFELLKDNEYLDPTIYMNF